MEDGVLTDKRLGELGRVADIALDDVQIGRIGQPATPPVINTFCIANGRPFSS
jgi:hypothetical protein